MYICLVSHRSHWYLEKKWPSVNCRRYLVAETRCAPISSPVVPWPSAVIPRTGAVNQYPLGIFWQQPGEVAQPPLKRPQRCFVRVSICTSAAGAWWRSTASSSSPQVKVFQPLPWSGVVNFQSVWDQGFAWTAWASMCSESSLSYWSGSMNTPNYLKEKALEYISSSSDICNFR